MKIKKYLLLASLMVISTNTIYAETIENDLRNCLTDIYNGIWTGFDQIVDSIPSNVIYYITTDSTTITPNTRYGIKSNRYVNGLGRLEFTSSRIYLEEDEFYGKSNLKCIFLNSAVEHLPSNIFGHCANLEIVNIPEYVNYISLTDDESYHSFSECSSLKYAHVDSRNKYYDSRDNCNGVIKTSSNQMILAAINSTIPASVTSVTGVFCKNVNVYNGLSYIDTYLIGPSNGNYNSYTIKSGTRFIGNGAFIYTKIKSITLPESVEYICKSAFCGCDSLKTLTLNNGLKRIEDKAFEGCYKIQSICLPSSLEYIGYWAFDRTRFKEVILEDGDKTLTMCSSYYENEDEYWVDQPLFQSCSIETLYLGRDINSKSVYDAQTGPDPFSGQSTIKKFHLGRYAGTYFPASDSLTDYFVDSRNPIEFSTNYNPVCTTKATLHVPDGSKESYESSNVWKNFMAIEEGGPLNIIDYTYPYEGVMEPYDKKVFGSTLKYNWCFNGLGKLYFDGDVTQIGEDAFLSCGMNRVSIPASVTEIGQGAFASCRNLDSMQISNSVLTIGKNAFQGCPQLTSVYIPASVTTIGVNPFSNCQLLNDIEVDSNNLYYDSRNHCNAIIRKSDNTLITGCKTTIIPNGVISIGEYSFYKSGLEQIDIPSSVQYIYSKAFMFTNLEHISIPASVKDISSQAFGFTNLKKVRFEDGDTSVYLSSNTFSSSISYGVFGESYSINSVYIGRNASNKSSSDKGVFFQYGGNDKVDTVIISNCVTDLDGWKFDRNSHIKTIYCLNENPPSISQFNTETYSNAVLYVPWGHLTDYQTASPWSNFTNIKQYFDGEILLDGETYNNQDCKDSVRLLYSRTFNNSSWQSLYIPFSISIDTFSKYGIEVAELNDTHMYDKDEDGVFEEVTLEFLRIKSGTTEANYPYLIRAQETGEKTIVFNNVILKPAASTSIDCSTVKQKFTFTGSYSGVSGADMYSNNYYAMSGGSLSRVSNQNVELKPQRWYMYIENRDGSDVEYYAPTMRLIIDGEYTEETSLRTISANRSEVEIYDLQGRKMSNAVLKSGIYLNGGKKVIIK